MNHQQSPLPPATRYRQRLLLLLGFLSFGLVGCGGDAAVPSPEPKSTEVSSKDVHQFCGACHAYPPPDTFPKSAWRKEVSRGFEFFESSGLPLRVPSMEGVVKYYEKRAPEKLPILADEDVKGPPPVRFKHTRYAVPGQPPNPAVSNVNLVHLYDDHKLDVLACDMRFGKVMVLKPYEAAPAWKMLANVSHPAHAEVVDLDGDKIKDIVVANLGSFPPTDDRCGSVVWLKGLPDGTFKPFTLLKDVGRVADVQAADFRGTGKLDLIVAVFGWHTQGEIILLENHTTDWSRPRFVPRVVDRRHGAIHVPVAHLSGKKSPDFVALISQEFETIVAFLNDGKGNFRKETIYTAPHPAYGSSGIQLVDINGDGKMDVLYTNGDVLDSYLLKPYHSIQWLENRGTYPFVHHHITAMYGTHRAVAADLKGNGTKDIVAVSFLPEPEFPMRKKMNLDGVIYLEQKPGGKFVRHSLEMITCNHVTCAIGDLFGDGKQHLVTGNFCSNKDKMDGSVTVWKNLGPTRKP